MHFPSLSALISDAHRYLAKGPTALILIEDDVEVASTIAHHANAGFANLIAFCAPDRSLPTDLPEKLHRVDFDVSAEDALQLITNEMIKALPDQWLYYCYNAEYLFYPFCEHRTVGEMLEFIREERRDTVMSYIVDLYAKDLTAHANGVDRDSAYFDKSGYYALARENADAKRWNGKSTSLAACAGGLRNISQRHGSGPTGFHSFAHMPGCKCCPIDPSTCTNTTRILAHGTTICRQQFVLSARQKHCGAIPAAAPSSTHSTGHNPNPSVGNHNSFWIWG